jgi:hypothetical protein
MSRGLVVVVLVALTARARADVDYFKVAKKPTTVTFNQGKDRSNGELMLLGGLLLGAAASVGVGAYYNLDSHDAASSVSARVLTGKSWSTDLQATYDRAHSSGVKAEIGYGLAGAFAVAALIAVWRTDPGETAVDLDPSAATATITPTPGGEMVGATWGF